VRACTPPYSSRVRCRLPTALHIHTHTHPYTHTTQMRPTPLRRGASTRAPHAPPPAHRHLVRTAATLPPHPTTNAAPGRRARWSSNQHDLFVWCRLAHQPPPSERPTASSSRQLNLTALSLALSSVAATGLPGVDAAAVDLTGGGGKGGPGGPGGGGGGGGGGDSGAHNPSSTPPPPAAAAGAADDDAAPTDVLVLDVGGMHCGGCAATVRRLLEAEGQAAGVRGASVNAATEAALVRVALPRPVVSAGPASVAAHLASVGSYLASVLGSRGFPSALRNGEPGASSALTAAARAAGEKRAAREAALKAAGLDLALASFLGGACAVGHIACCIPGLPQHLRRFGDPRLMALLSGLALLGPGRSVLEKGAQAASQGRPDMNTLVGLGASATYAVSTAAFLLPGLGWPTYFEEPAMLLGAVLAGRALEARAKLRATADSAALYALLPANARLVVGPAAARLGAALEAAEKGEKEGRRRPSLSRLFHRRPSSTTAPPATTAAASTALAAGGWREVPADAVAPGDIVAVLPGDLIPVDGVVVGGRSAVDEAALAGEPLPATKAPGARVSAGTSNCEGSLLVRAARVGAATTIADVVAAVEAAQGRAPSIQRAADAVAGRFAAGVLCVSGATALFWGGGLGARLVPGAIAKVAPPSVAAALARGSGVALGGVPAAAALLGLQMACNVLVVACPCAVGLASPTAVLVGTAAGARRGLLVRGGDVLEAAAGVDTVILDKTGTLTVGVPTVARVVLVGGGGGGGGAGGKRKGGRRPASLAPGEVLALAAAVEAHSAHPVAKAVVQAASSSPAPTSSYTSDPASITQEAGSGVAGVVGGRAVRVGNWEWVGRGAGVHQGLPPPDLLEAAGEAAPASPSTSPPRPRALAYVSVDGTLVAAFAIEDELRPDAAATVAALVAAGVRPLLVSGDAPGAVAAVAAAVGIPPSDAAASIKPRGKAAIVTRLQATGHRVAMVGDGVNDAAALAAADVGVAMGGGAGGAVEAASIILLGDRLPSLPDALYLARATLAKVHQNLGWALAYNAVAIPLAAGAALPTRLGWALTPAASGLMMGASSLAVMANSLSLRKWGDTDERGGGCAAPPLPGLPAVAGVVSAAGRAWAGGLAGWLEGGGVGGVGVAGDQGL